jgi:hypothetical protein
VHYLVSSSRRRKKRWLWNDAFCGGLLMLQGERKKDRKIF